MEGSFVTRHRRQIDTHIHSCIRGLKSWSCAAPEMCWLAFWRWLACMRFTFVFFPFFFLLLYSSFLLYCFYYFQFHRKRKKKKLTSIKKKERTYGFLERTDPLLPSPFFFFWFLRLKGRFASAYAFGFLLLTGGEAAARDTPSAERFRTAKRK